MAINFSMGFLFILVSVTDPVLVQILTNSVIAWYQSEFEGLYDSSVQTLGLPSSSKPSSLNFPLICDVKYATVT